MVVRRIVANIETADPAAAARFYGEGLGLAVVMDHGFIVTYASESPARPELSFASEGGSNTPVPALSIEVDDLDAVLSRLQGLGFSPTYGPTDEPWGVRRFFVRDPFDCLVNILEHH